MKFADFVVHKAIQPALTSTDEANAIRVLVGAMQSHGVCEPDAVDAIVQAVLDRESLGTTGLGHDAAIPHAKHPGVARCAGAIGVSREGVDFHSVDRKLVHLIFLVLSPPELAKEHVMALEWIARHLRNPTFCRLLRGAQCTEEIQDLLNQADEQRFV